MSTKYYETYYSKHIVNSGKAAYVERNKEMINKSDFCIIYYNKNYSSPRKKFSHIDLTAYQSNGGTKISYNYVLKKNKTIINIYDKLTNSW